MNLDRSTVTRVPDSVWVRFDLLIDPVVLALTATAFPRVHPRLHQGRPA